MRVLDLVKDLIFLIGFMECFVQVSLFGDFLQFMDYLIVFIFVFFINVLFFFLVLMVKWDIRYLGVQYIVWYIVVMFMQYFISLLQFVDGLVMVYFNIFINESCFVCLVGVKDRR